ncbi:hypothetical protein DVH24_010935 [Malus domestica]|uniref:Uncharacterized protein n=1 Tax=Malus domestica TaxID=3750 RepID=A0A498JT50_MALDO|nr:hypothetical protein DVH24_010935 [Malus domestica]
MFKFMGRQSNGNPFHNLPDYNIFKDRPMSLIFDVAYDWIPPFKLHTIVIINCQRAHSYFGNPLMSLTFILEAINFPGQFPLILA